VLIGGPEKYAPPKKVENIFLKKKRQNEVKLHYK
jgi:hypothetical protein